MSILTDLIKHRTCKFCGRGAEDNKGHSWHKDRWGRLGYYCHLCYDCILYAEKSRK